MKHLNYLLNHDLPVILIIVDPVNHNAYWTNFDANKTQITGFGWRITIPKYNIFGKKSKSNILALAGEITDYVPVIESFWAFNRLIEEKEHIVLLLDRQDIESYNTSPLEQFFERLQVTRELILISRGKIDFLIHGYDDDSRDLFEIPEVRQWFTLVEPKIKYWSFFLNLSPEAQGIDTLYKCKSNCTRISSTEISISREQILDFFKRHFAWLNEFCLKYQIVEEINLEVSQSLIKKLLPKVPSDL